MRGNPIHRNWTYAFGLALALLVPAMSSRADDAPKSPPDTAADQRARPGAMMLSKLTDNLAKLDLTDDQKQKVKALFDDIRQQLLALRDSAANTDRQALAEKGREIFTGVRGKLAEILTPEQQEKLRDLMQQQPAAPPAAVERPKSADEQRSKAAPTDAPKMNMQDGPGRTTVTVKPAAVTPALPTGKPIDIGQSAPDFSLKTTSDKPTTLGALKGKVVVLVFGSYSTPSFRERVPALEKLASDYGTRATFLIVYTREAHAVGEWEVGRNKADDISVEQPKSLEDRRTVAQLAISNLKITLPVLIDGMDDAVAKSYGLAPNGAVVIGRDGNVSGRQHWFEPVGLREQIDTAVAVRLQKPEPTTQK